MTDLSPAAQAVLDAGMEYSGPAFEPLVRKMVAAALRAAADQVVPLEQYQQRRGMRPGGTGALSPDEDKQDQRAATRRQLLAIAAELEGSND